MTEDYRSYGILGLDILEAKKLIVSPQKSELRDETSNRTSQLSTAENLPTAVVVRISKGEVKDHSRYDSLEKECLTLLTKYPDLTETAETQQFFRDYFRRLSTAHDKGRRCNEVCKRQMSENFKDLAKICAVVRGEDNVYASPIAVVLKKDSKIRIFTQLNKKKTRPLSYPLSRIDTLRKSLVEPDFSGRLTSRRLAIAFIYILSIKNAQQ